MIKFIKFVVNYKQNQRKIEAFDKISEVYRIDNSKAILNFNCTINLVEESNVDEYKASNKVIKVMKSKQKFSNDLYKAFCTYYDKK